MTTGTTTSRTRTNERERRGTFARHPADLVRLAVGIVLLFLTAIPVERNEVGQTEENLFRLINDLPMPAWLWPFVWVVMQLGNLGAVPLTAVLAAVTRRWRLAFDVAVAGGTIWFLARVIKSFVQRGRPEALLDDVHIYGDPAGGLGYVSGHSAVATALATVVSPYLGRRGRRIAWTLAIAVCFSRVWVGAHLPLDVLGGAILGWLAGVIVHLLLGAPGGRPSTAPVRKALENAGLDPVDVTAHRGLDARRAASYFATTASGEELFVKFVPRERRDNDLYARAWRYFHRRRRPGATGPPPQQVQHEAAMALLAQAANVRIPPVVLAQPAGNGAGLLVQQWIGGRNLDELSGPQIPDSLLEEIWRQVEALHQARVAHGELGADNIVVDDEGQPWLADFSHAEAAAAAPMCDQDIGDLLVDLAQLVGTERAVDSARTALGDDAVDRAGTLVGTGRLGLGARRQLREHPELRDQLASAVSPNGRAT